jgi:GNAT superfamily N-acetyltransferase
MNPIMAAGENIRVRSLHPSDVEVTNDLLRQLGYDMPIKELAARIARVLDAEAHFAAVAEQAANVVGLIHVYERPALEKPCQAVVQSLIVDRDLRGTGVGTLLIASAETWAQRKGLTHVVLHTRVERDDARAFYEHLGYHTDATSHLMIKALACI